jgi:hypothetical protein
MIKEFTYNLTPITLYKSIQTRPTFRTCWKQPTHKTLEGLTTALFAPFRIISYHCSSSDILKNRTKFGS